MHSVFAIGDVYSVFKVTPNVLSTVESIPGASSDGVM